MPTIDEWLENGRMADGVRMTDERLDQVFDLVKPVGNWKMPINAVVPPAHATVAEITNAVIWFAGGVPEVTVMPDGFIRVTGAGYYSWVGA